MTNSLLDLQPNPLTEKKKNPARFKNQRTLLVAGLMTCVLSACAHRFFYSPEIKGAGARQVHNGAIDYTVPPNGIPELKMRIRTLGVQKIKGQKMIAIRVSFVRPNGEVTPKHPEREFLLPAEQTLRIGNHEIKPGFIHTKARKDSAIELTGLANETIDMLFPLPPGNKGVDEIEIFYFKWMLHYGKGQVESQTARFDRYDAAPQQSAEAYPFDNDYPYDISPMPMPGWNIDEDPFWWPGPWL